MPVPLRHVAAALLAARARPPSGQLRTRVWPAYLDLNFHMNHASYLEVMELGRWHWCAERELLAGWLRAGIRPIVVHQDISYRRELKPMQRFTLETRLVKREGKTATYVQRFRVGERTHAEGSCRFLLVRKGAVLDEPTVASVLDPLVEPPLAAG